MAVIRAIRADVFSDPTMWSSGTVPTAADDVVANNFVVTMDISATVISLRNDNGLGGTTGGQFQFSVSGVSVTLTGGVPITQGSGAPICILANNSTGTVNIFTNSSITVSPSTMISHTGAGAFIITFPTLTQTGGNVTAVLTRTGSGTLTLNGNITSGPQTNAANQIVSNSTAGLINVNGIVTGGNSTAGSGTVAILNTNAGATITLNGSVFGGNGGSSYAINSNGPINIQSGSVTCNGSITAIIANGGITVNGTVTSNGGGIPIVITVAASATITGNVIIGTGTVTCIDALTNGASSVTLAGNFTNRAGRQAIACRIIFLSDTVTNQLTFNTPGGASRTLYSDDNFPNLPSTDSVRDGATYGPGATNVGTLKVPPPETVLLGVPTDATTGTLLMTPFDFITELNESGIPVAVRMRNCATVDSTGSQVASYGV